MDFDLHFTGEDEEFSKEVSAWLKENIPPGFEWPVEPYDRTPEQVEVKDELVRKLGAKGWFAPDFPKEYGGGGMSDERVAVLQQEFIRTGYVGAPEIGAGGLLGFASDIIAGTVIRYGPEDLKREIVPLILRGERIQWLNETEPEHGTDNAAIESTAIRDGDDYIVNGEKIYVGREDPADWRKAFLWTPLVTKPGAPRHENMGVFVIPADLPGISLEVLELIGAESKKHRVFMKDVRVPSKYLVGGPEANGWEVLQASLAAEHGGGGRIIPPERLTSKLIRYCKETKRNGQPLSNDPFIQDILVKLWIEDQKERLYTLSTYWTSKTKKWAGRRYKGVQTALHRKVEMPKLAKAVLDILGPIAVTSDPELWLLKGRVWRVQRMGCVTHIAGTPESLKIMASRGIGMTRPKEEGGKK